jgi:hypothetical protein
MQLPRTIPQGSRIVVRQKLGIDPSDGREKFSDVIGHAVEWDGKELVIDRDPTPDGRRPGKCITIGADTIVALKPVPERKKRS